MKNLYLDALAMHTSERLTVSGFQPFHSKDVSTVFYGHHYVRFYKDAL
jgi:hypothetical protein